MGWGPSPWGWFPSDKNEEQGFRLDIVSLLAVIGESSMAEQSQALTASWFCVLPRLLPAPQVLLKASRPFRMPSVKVEKVIGVHGGTVLDTLNYFPNIVHPLEDLKPFGLQVWKIDHSEEVLKGERMIRAERQRQATVIRGNEDEDFEPPRRREAFARTKDPERGHPHLKRLSRRATSLYTEEEERNLLPAFVPVKMLSPLTIIDVVSFLSTLGILGISIWNRDGIACLALATLSAISSIVGYASKWKPHLATRPSLTPIQRGDVAIRSREGGFIIIKCTEEVARELYFGTEQCEYVIQNPTIYRAMVGVATFLLMLSVVLLGNCKFYQQLAIGIAYIVLNGLYWMVSLSRKQRLWDLARYDCKNVTEEEYGSFKNAHVLKGVHVPSYTKTLWYAIYASESTSWCAKSNAVPKSEVWNKWLLQAGKEIEKGNRHWDAVEYKNYLLKEENKKFEGSAGRNQSVTINPVVNIHDRHTL